MTVVEFLAHLLQTHANTLQRLAAFFGEEELFEILELGGEAYDENPSLHSSPNFKIDPNWLIDQPLRTIKTPVYLELEGIVRELNLAAVLEFHLWAYPFYRQLIESSLELSSI